MDNAIGVREQPIPKQGRRVQHRPLGKAPQKVQVPVAVRMLENFGVDIGKCPKCAQGRMEIVATYRKGILVKTYENEPKQKGIRNKDPVFSQSSKS